MWFALILVGGFILLAANIESGFSRQRYIPLHSICECLPEETGIDPMTPNRLSKKTKFWMKDQIWASYAYDFYEIFMMSCLMYSLRRIPTEFSIMKELGDILLIRLVKMGFGYTILIWDFDDLFVTNLVYI